MSSERLEPERRVIDLSSSRPFRTNLSIFCPGVLESSTIERTRDEESEMSRKSQGLIEVRDPANRRFASFGFFRGDVACSNVEGLRLAVNNKLEIGTYLLDLESRSHGYSRKRVTFDTKGQTSNFFSAVAFEKELNSMQAIAELRAGVSLFVSSTSDEFIKLPYSGVSCLALRQGLLASYDRMAGVRLTDLRDTSEPAFCIPPHVLQLEGVARGVDLRGSRLSLDSSHGSVLFDLRKSDTHIRSSLSKSPVNQLTFLGPNGAVFADLITGEIALEGNELPTFKLEDSIVDLSLGESGELLLLSDNHQNKRATLRLFSPDFREIQSLEVGDKGLTSCLLVAPGVAALQGPRTLSVFELIGSSPINLT